MKYWLFSGQPELWETYKEKIENGNLFYWSMTGFKGAEKGDLGFIKIGGKIKKIVAKVKIDSIIGSHTPEGKSREQLQVNLKAIESYINNPVSYESIKDESLLNKINTQGSSFKLSDEEYKIISDLIRDSMK